VTERLGVAEGLEKFTSTSGYQSGLDTDTSVQIDLSQQLLKNVSKPYSNLKKHMYLLNQNIHLSLFGKKGILDK